VTVPGAGFTVDTALLHEHATQVEALAGRMRLAAEAARPVAVDAYGQVGRLFAGAVIDGSQRAAAAVGRMADAADDHARHLYASAAGYLLADAELAELFDSIR
jgi:hypothetical protein